MKVEIVGFFWILMLLNQGLTVKVGNTLIAETDEEDDEDSSQLDKLVEVKGVGVAVSHPTLELDQNNRRKKVTNAPKSSHSGLKVSNRNKQKN